MAIQRQRSTLTSRFKSLPDDLVIGIVGRVASLSRTDLGNLMLSCKDFGKLAEDNHIYKVINLDDVQFLNWGASPGLSLYRKCLRHGNPEAVFRQGVVQYFSYTKTAEGLDNLNRAAESGHAAAKYLIGMLQIFMGDEAERQLGMEILREMLSRKIVVQCRIRINLVRGVIWMRNKLPLALLQRICHRHEVRTFLRGWFTVGGTDAIDLVCEDCKCDREIFIFSTMFCERD